MRKPLVPQLRWLIWEMVRRDKGLTAESLAARTGVPKRRILDYLEDLINCHFVRHIIGVGYEATGKRLGHKPLKYKKRAKGWWKVGVSGKSHGPNTRIYCPECARILGHTKDQRGAMLQEQYCWRCEKKYMIVHGYSQDPSAATAAIHNEG